MDHLKALNHILESGDAFERWMYQDETFNRIFPNYPLVWAEYVASRRDPQQPLLKTRWQKFAEHNYTAIVRCWNAKNALNRLNLACESYFTHQTARVALECHEGMVAFTALAQSAAENLRKAFEAEPVKDAAAFEQKSGLDSQPGSLKWLLAARNHCLHDALSPLHSKDGILHIDLTSLIVKDPRWESPKTPKDATELFASVWSTFARHMDDAWASMYSRLRSKELPSYEVVSLFNLPSDAISCHSAAASGTYEVSDSNIDTSGVPIIIVPTQDSNED